MRSLDLTFVPGAAGLGSFWDPISPLGVAQELARQLPRARLLTFDSDDHWVSRVRAAATAQVIRDFLLESSASEQLG